MKDQIVQEITIDLENGECIQIRGTGLGEPEKALIIERALEFAALERRRGAPEGEDFEEAARELCSDAELMEKGCKVRRQTATGASLATPCIFNQEGADCDVAKVVKDRAQNNL